MGRPPALVIVARHGARLDAADSQWHLTSPAPYDPPLTYGGWRQSQALGARIANILKAREETPEAGADTASNDDHNGTPKRRKYKIIIHSSPYLRCIQTSIAISAGIHQSQSTGNILNIRKAVPHTARLSDDAQLRNSPRLTPIPEPKKIQKGLQDEHGSTSANDGRIWLRVDAFLGEWQSPDYYADITPPPDSRLMVAGAKADLLRPAEPIDGIIFSEHAHNGHGHFPGGWNSGTAVRTISGPSIGDTTSDDLPALDEGIPRLGRANSHHIHGPDKFSIHTSLINRDLTDGDRCYEPPTPTYAISSTQPIPQGYVAHAQAACTKVDIHWDSMRPPLDWGTGGEFGENWSALHRRFRKGFNSMILWYQGHGSRQRHDLSENPSTEDDPVKSDDPEVNGLDDDETDVVLILVTHGAGCNALIGALTNQPVLIDSGMASMTLAVRKSDAETQTSLDGSVSATASFVPHRRRSSIDTGLLQKYDVKLTASTDHLRIGSRFLQHTRPSRAPSLPVREKSPYRYERNVSAPQQPRHSSASSPLHEAMTIRHDGSATSRNGGGTASTAKTGTHQDTDASPISSTLSSPGLWSMSSRRTSANDRRSTLTDSLTSAMSEFALGPPATRLPISSKGNENTIVNNGNAESMPILSLNTSTTTLTPDDIDNTSTSNHRTLLAQLNTDGSTPTKQTNTALPAAYTNSPTSGLSPMTTTGLWGLPSQSLGFEPERDKGHKRRWTLSKVP